MDPDHMRILSVSRTPVAGVAVLLPRYINKFTSHEGKSLVGGTGYRDGRRWARPDGLIGDRRACQQLVEWADVLVLHNCRLPKHVPLRGKRAICYYHSEPRNVDRKIESKGIPTYVIAQGHSLLYPGIPTLPNVVDIDHALMLPTQDRCDPAKGVLIGYAPSNKHGADYMRINRFSPKGWPETMPVLERLKREKLANYELFFGLPFDECMKRRKKCHIFIDEVLTGSYHRSTLEACCHAQVAVNNLSEEVRAIIAKVTGWESVPWLRCNADALYETLKVLIQEPERLAQMMQDSRDWMEAFWHPKKLLERFWIPALRGAKVI